MTLPEHPKLYHIVHIDNLPSVITTGGLLSDRLVQHRGLAPIGIGMSSIKTDRLRRAVPCHPGTFVGDYVPFYLCPRSVMLYVIHRGDHAGLSYRGGQRPIVHLQFDLNATVVWAEAKRLPWAFSTVNARAVYAQFGTGVANLGMINWSAVTATDFRLSDVKEAKQAEVLIHRGVPWHLVE